MGIGSVFCCRWRVVRGLAVGHACGVGVLSVSSESVSDCGVMRPPHPRVAFLSRAPPPHPPPPPTPLPVPRPYSFVPETILKARKRRDDLRVAVAAARKVEKGAAKVRRAGELKRAETYLKGESIAIERARIAPHRAVPRRSQRTRTHAPGPPPHKVTALPR